MQVGQTPITNYTDKNNQMRYQKNHNKQKNNSKLLPYQYPLPIGLYLEI